MNTRPKPRILVAGIGNIFFGDDAFGVEVVQQLLQRPILAEVLVVDFGIRGIDLYYALADGYENVILVDAAPRGGSPGELYVIEPETPADAAPAFAEPFVEMHHLDPARVLQLATRLGGTEGRVLLVGCEPTPLEETDDIQPGLSPEVAAAIPQAVELVNRLIGDLLAQNEPQATLVDHANTGRRVEGASVEGLAVAESNFMDRENRK